MKIDNVNQLLMNDAVSDALLNRALEDEARSAMRLCRSERSPMQPAQLRAAVIAALPLALDLSLRELVCDHWWPRQATSDSTPADCIEWSREALLDREGEDGRTVALVLVATLKLEQDGFTAQFSAHDCVLRVGQDRGWLATLRLSIADWHASAGGQVFHERRTVVHLARHAWTLPQQARISAAPAGSNALAA